MSSRDRLDARPEAPAVGFELRFAGPSRADAAAEPRQRGAGADEPRQQVFQLGELDLQLAFARPRAPREDVEDELRPIDDLAADRLFDVAQLRRRQLIVEDDDVDVGLGGRRAPASGSCRRRETWTDPASAAPAARAARRRRRRPAARPASSSSDRSASSRRARPAISPTSAARSRCFHARSVLSHARISSHGIAPARTSAAAAPVTSTIVDGGAAAASGRRRSADRCDRRASARPHPGRPSPVAPLTLALVAVSGRPRGAADRPRHVVGRHAHADASGAARDVARQRARSRDQQRQRSRPEPLGQARGRRATAVPDARRPAAHRRR